MAVVLRLNGCTADVALRGKQFDEIFPPLVRASSSGVMLSEGTVTCGISRKRNGISGRTCRVLIRHSASARCGRQA
jgi:hypothetical protein